MGRIPLMAFELNNVELKIKDVINETYEKIFVKVDLIPYTEIALLFGRAIHIKSGNFRMLNNYNHMTFNTTKALSNFKRIKEIENLKYIQMILEDSKSKIALADIYNMLDKHDNKVCILYKYNIFASKDLYKFNIVTDDEAAINNKFVFLYTIEDTSGNIIYSSKYKEVKNNELNLHQ